MRNIVGQAVRKEDFWNRNDILEDIKDAIESGTHILISAPRRVGKTSIMYRLLDTTDEQTIVLYVTTESADTQNEFWQKLFNALLDDDFVNSLEHSAQSLWQKLKTIRIKKISMQGGVEFGDGGIVDYKQAFISIVKNFTSQQKLIIMIDEFAQSIENIKQLESSESALKVLKDQRELRQDKKFNEKLTFIYAGSIGLEGVVASMNATKHINDLNSIKIPPLDKNDAHNFCLKLCADLNMHIEQTHINELLEKIEWLIPFYIQLIIQELRRLNRKQEKIDTTLIDQAIVNALDHRNHFESWLAKIRTAFKNSAYLYAKDVLNTVSVEKAVNSLELSNMATKHGLNEDEAKSVIYTLVYDGYINNNDDNKVYRFNSPILRMWWNKNVAN